MHSFNFAQMVLLKAYIVDFVTDKISNLDDSINV